METAARRVSGRGPWPPGLAGPSLVRLLVYHGPIAKEGQMQWELKMDVVCTRRGKVQKATRWFNRDAAKDLVSRDLADRLEVVLADEVGRRGGPEKLLLMVNVWLLRMTSQKTSYTPSCVTDSPKCQQTPETTSAGPLFSSCSAGQAIEKTSEATSGPLPSSPMEAPGAGPSASQTSTASSGAKPKRSRRSSTQSKGS
jgi:hypothetical protein